MSNEDNDLTNRKTNTSEMINPPCEGEHNSTSSTNSSTTGNNLHSNFSNVLVEGLLVEKGNNNCDAVNDDNNTNNGNNIIRTLSPTIVQELPQAPLIVTCTSSNQPRQTNLTINITSGAGESSVHSSGGGTGENLISQLPQQNNNYFTLQSLVSLQSSPRSSYSSLEGTASLESANSTVSFVTEIEILPRKHIVNSGSNRGTLFSSRYEQPSVNMEESAESSDKAEADPSTTKEVEVVGAESDSDKPSDNNAGGGGGDGDVGESGNQDGDNYNDDEDGCQEEGAASMDDNDEEGMGMEEGGEDEEEDDDTTTLSSEAVVDDIELILMPEMCQDLTQTNLSPKLVRVTELKLNVDDVFCDDDDDQSSRHEFRSIVDEVCEDEEDDDDAAETQQEREDRLSIGDDEVSSGSELIGISSRKKAAHGMGGESSSKSSSSSGRRRRSTSGRISSGVQTEITALEEPTALTGHQGFWRKPGKSGTGRLGLPSAGGSGKKLNWKSELTLLPSKMKVKQGGFNSFESNDERDQYSPRVAKFTSQDTLNLSSQFLKPSTLYRTRNLSRNLNQFASSESTFMLPMSSEQQLSAESPRFRDRVSSSTSGGGVVGNFKGTSTSHSYSAYQISSILSGAGSGTVGGVGYGPSYYGSGLTPVTSARRQPSISGYSSGAMMMGLSGCSSRHFRSSMPDLNAVNKSYGDCRSMADTHRRRNQPSKSIKHHSSSSGFRLQKRSSSDEETSSLIDESERCLRSSIDLLLTDELPSPGGDSCFRSTGFGASSYGGLYSSRRFCSQPILNDQAYPPEMRDPSMGSPFLPRKLSDMRCSRWAKVILPNGHVAVVSVKETDEIQDTLTVHTDTGCVINIPFRKVVFAWKSKR